MNRGSLVVGLGAGLFVVGGLGTDLVVVIIQLSGNGGLVEVIKLLAIISSSLLGIKVTLFIARAFA